MKLAVWLPREDSEPQFLTDSCFAANSFSQKSMVSARVGQPSPSGGRWKLPLWQKGHQREEGGEDGISIASPGAHTPVRMSCRYMKIPDSGPPHPSPASQPALLVSRALSHPPPRRTPADVLEDSAGTGAARGGGSQRGACSSFLAQVVR